MSPHHYERDSVRGGRGGGDSGYRSGGDGVYGESGGGKHEGVYSGGCGYSREGDGGGCGGGGRHEVGYTEMEVVLSGCGYKSCYSFELKKCVLVLSLSQTNLISITKTSTTADKTLFTNITNMVKLLYFTHTVLPFSGFLQFDPNILQFAYRSS